MATTDRLFDRGTRASDRMLLLIGDELRERRLALGLSQRAVGDAARTSKSTVSRIEAGRHRAASIVDIARLSSVLGLDPLVRLYPGSEPIRDVAQARRLRGFLQHVAQPLRWSADVPLPPRQDGPPERRAWDAVLFGHGQRTTIELESRLRDVQATLRRFRLKRQDDPAEHWLLILADTRTNREVLASFPELFADLPMLRRTGVLANVERGAHPPSGVVRI